jgi:hypothetical protein
VGLANRLLGGAESGVGLHPQPRVEALDRGEDGCELPILFRCSGHLRKNRHGHQAEHRTYQGRTHHRMSG